MEQVRDLLLDKNGNQLRGDGMLPFDEVNESIWDLGAEVFLPCAASRLVTREQVDRMVAAGLEVVSSGANVPFADARSSTAPSTSTPTSPSQSCPTSSPTAAWPAHSRS